MLQRCERELAAANSTIFQKDKTIKSLQKRNNQLIETTKLARSAARDAKSYAKGVESTAHASSKKLEAELSKARVEVDLKEEEMKEKEATWQQTMDEKVSKARDEELVSLF